MSSDSEAANTSPCSVCKVPSTLKCTSCRIAFYCSQDHQKQDWKHHKKECTSIVQAEDDQFGRYWIASRNINAGALILLELPAFCGPIPNGDGFDSCVACCTTLLPVGTSFNEGIRKSCSRCGWPVCGTTCENATHHLENECPIFVANRIKYPLEELTFHDMYYGIQYLRGMLIKNKDSRTWKALMNLQDVNNCKGLENRPEPSLLSKLTRSAFKVTDLGTVEDWNKLIRIIRVNVLALSRQEADKLFPSEFSALYLKGSLFTHSCVPNASRTISYSPNFEVNIRAATNIKKGEMITICYYHENSFFGTEKRLEKTLCSSGFICKCRRCVDPTELGTFASAIICDQCTLGKQGIVLPKSFHDDKEPYTCLNCGHKKSRNEVRSFISQLHKEISPDESLTLTKDFKLLESFIFQCAGVKLHKNHWLLQEAARGCLIAYEDTWISNSEHLQRFITHGRYLLNLAEITAPGISFDKSCLLLKVVQAIQHDAEIKEKILSRDEVKKCWMEVNNWARQSAKYWITDVQNKPNNKKISMETEAVMSIIMESDHKIKQFSD